MDQSHPLDSFTDHSSSPPPSQDNNNGNDPVESIKHDTFRQRRGHISAELNHHPSHVSFRHNKSDSNETPPIQIDDAHKDKPRRSRWKTLLAKLGLYPLPSQVAWIPSAYTWPKQKPVIRSFIVAWICMLMLLVRPVEQMLGNASFLVLISAFIQPADLPLVALAEREMFTLLFCGAAWIWALIAIAIAHAVRTHKLPQSSTDLAAVVNAEYLETAPAVVCGVFLSIGSATLLYVKVRFGPGPFLFASILSCILLDICLTYAPLYPFPFYSLGQSIMVPLAVKAAVALIVSLLFFPESVNGQFTTRLIAVLTPLAKACNDQVMLFQQSPLDSEFDFCLVRKCVTASEAGLMPLAMSSRLLTRELSFSLASGEDLKNLERLTRALIPSADGWAYYFAMIQADIETAHFPKTPLPSRLATAAPTPIATPRGSHEQAALPESATTLAFPPDHHHQRQSGRFQRLAMGISHTSRTSSSHLRRFYHDHFDASHRTHSHTNLFHNLIHKKESVPVAIWESIRFGNLEAHLHTSAANPTTEMLAHLLHETCKDVLETNGTAIHHIVGYLQKLNSERFQRFRARFTHSNESLTLQAHQAAQQTLEVIDKVQQTLDEFKTTKRLGVIQPYRTALEEQDAESSLGYGEIGKIHHRYLYQIWLHQFHTITFTEKLLVLLKQMEQIQRTRTCLTLWGPSWPRLFTLDVWRSVGQDSSDGQTVEEDPQQILQDHDDSVTHSSSQQTYPSTTHLGSAKPRDPDALDPEGKMQIIGQKLYFLVGRLFQGHLLFAVKAAVLVALVSLPMFLRSSAAWCFRNRAIWSIFMAQLALARFRGETAFSLISRLIATLIGATIGLVIWYISTGSGDGNAYGTAATTAISFPILMTFRLYFPGPPITAIITSVTVALIIGYSWKDVTDPVFGSPGYGWNVAWLRFVTVSIGVTFAYIFSYLPPSSKLRQYQRLSHATTITELGKVYCQVVSIAAVPQGHQQGHGPGHDDSEIIFKRLLAIRGKLFRLNLSASKVSYEFSLRGKWPKERYSELFKIQMEITKLLSHCLTILQTLTPYYSISLLRRTRFLDPHFLGDVISIISLCSNSLKTSSPMPQITACPLVDRFLLFPHGFHPSSSDQKEVLTISLLDDYEYLCFSVGVATVFGLVVRIDKLCFIVKQLVGESFQIPADIHQTNVMR